MWVSRCAWTCSDWSDAGRKFRKRVVLYEVTAVGRTRHGVSYCRTSRIWQWAPLFSGTGCHCICIRRGRKQRYLADRTWRFKFAPVWNNSENSIAFTSDSLGNPDIWIMSNIGQNLQQITTDPANDAMPDFNPGGTQIVFTSDRTGNPDIWIITVATVDITRLTFDTANDFWPRWSSTGLIAFVSNRSGRNEIWPISATGGEPQQVTNRVAGYDMPSWSPSGQFLACTSNCSGNWDVWIQEFGGNTPRAISPIQATLDVEFDTGPSLVSDTSGLIFSSTRGGDLDIWQMLFFASLSSQ